MAPSSSSTPDPRGPRRPDVDVPVRRIDRILAFMSLGLLLLSIVCFLAIIVGSWSGANMGTGIWPTIGTTVYIAPVVAFGLLMAVLVMTFVRKARVGKGR
ncbi:multidrug ABC transporter ATPase [Microbacterium sp.]|uniref:multidrug ABC transporter ATPase n=1 Tax=Microbacterium sp. TaxID=51671 RepID=UPI0039E5D129